MVDIEPALADKQHSGNEAATLRVVRFACKVGLREVLIQAVLLVPVGAKDHLQS